MVGIAVAVTAIGPILNLIAAQGSGLITIPVASAACIYHVVVHAQAARAPRGERVNRLVAISDILLGAALLFQLHFTPGYNCSDSTLSGTIWQLRLAADRGCIQFGTVPAFIADFALFRPGRDHLGQAAGGGRRGSPSGIRAVSVSGRDRMVLVDDDP
ncbi:MAG TPA: hypothetical protein VFW46_01740 [Stellaceae bacterium]|nr:hypothetical protein [Stellaceae bacterium]